MWSIIMASSITLFRFRRDAHDQHIADFQVPPAHGLPATVNHLRSRLILSLLATGALLGKPAASTSNHKAFAPLFSMLMPLLTKLGSKLRLSVFSSLRWCCHQLF